MAKVLEWKASFERTGSFPLDIDGVFSNTTALDKYVSGSTRAYVGQIVAVTGGSESCVYRIDQDDKGAKVLVKLYDEKNIQEALDKVECKVKDVQVNNSSVVSLNNGIANIDLTAYATKTELTGYTTDAEFTALSNKVDGKQDSIGDLEEIRNNAQNGATAYGWKNHADAGYVTKTVADSTYLGKSDNAVSATKATQDGSGNTITSHYATKEEINRYIPTANILNEIQGSEEDLVKKVVSAKYISDKLDGINKSIEEFSLFEVVNRLPENDIDKRKIYLVPDYYGESGNTFTEYIYVTDKGNNSSYWEILGQYTVSTEVDLTDYAKKEDLTDYAKKSDLSGYTTNDEYQTLLSKYQTLSDNYSDLLERVLMLESILSGTTESNLITTDNIKKHAIIEIKSSDTDIDVTTDKESGVATIKLNKITNIAYDDAIEQ